MKFIIIFAITSYSLCAFSQSRILLEACNRIDNSNDRLLCFEEIQKNNKEHQLKPEDKMQLAINAAQKEFSEFQEIINTGISYNNYSTLISKPASALGTLKLELKGTMPHMINTLEAALEAYSDAGKIWHASIFNSQDGGIIFGKILNPETSGLMNIVQKYELMTERKLTLTNLPPDPAIRKIWMHASNLTSNAFNGSLSNKSGRTSDIEKDPFRPLPIMDGKCKNKYSLEYDPKVCEGQFN